MLGKIQNQKSMNVMVTVDLCSSPVKDDKDQMSSVAKCLTNNDDSVVVHEPKNNSKKLTVEFTVYKARQMDVVDKIGKKFSYGIENYNHSSISFPKKRSVPRKKPAHNREKYTPKQAQYLAFMYYFLKVNGYPATETDMQRYFSSAPTTVHRMILQLEQKGLIERVSTVENGIKQVLPRNELPDLK